MKKYFPLLALFAFSFQAQAQNEKTCGAEHMYQQMLKKNPHIAQVRANGDKQAQDFKKNGSVKTAGVLRIIPVVVHIIHNYGAENTSKAQVLDALRILNEDFQKMNADTAQVVGAFKPLIGNAQVEFRLANKDPNGNCTDGITRTVSTLTFSADDNVKQLISWDNSKYYNIWVVSSISFGAGGYAYYPGTANAGDEGVVVINSQFGSIGTANGSNFTKRTLTHETGHYLNLAHTWGSSNSCGDLSNCGVDDGVTDTPDNIGNCLSCNLAANTCGSLENVENYMDYSTCTKMFTIGQQQRMDAALNSNVGYRLSLWQASNLIATGVQTSTQTACIMKSDFISDLQAICAGNTIAFTDVSSNGSATTWSWSFPGGTPSTSTIASPLVQYNSAGTYNVTLTASNIAGIGNSLTRTAYIHVGSDTATYSAWQYYEGFEGKPLPNVDWSINNYDNGLTWYQTTTASSSGFKSARLDNIYNNITEVDELISPSVDLSKVNVPSLYFKLAYARQNNGANDKLVISLSTDCGNSWKTKFLKKSGTMTTGPDQTSPFVPNGNQWAQHVLNLASYASQKNVLFKFAFTSGGGGNNIYLDDINITSPNGIANSDTEKLFFTVYPNPAEKNTVVAFRLNNSENVVLSVYDVFGREVSMLVNSMLPAGDHTYGIDNTDLSHGLYFVQLSVNGRTSVEKLVVR